MGETGEMRHSGSCLKHPLEGGATDAYGCERAKRLTLSLNHTVIIISMMWVSDS